MMTDDLPHMPFPQRDETMYLQSLGPKDKHAEHSLTENTRRGFYNPLEVDDIQGTKPKTLHPHRMNKPKQQFTYDFQDGMKPQRLHPMDFQKPQANGKPYNLTNDDIEGSKPRQNNWNFKRTTDPLNPTYNLPSYYPHVQPVPALMRDTLNIADIEGAKPKGLHTRWHQRDPINYSDVPGSTVGWKPTYKQIYAEPRESIQCNDINGDGLFKSKRVTNPLTPRYRYDVPKDFQSRPNTGEAGAAGSDRPQTTPAHWLIGDVPKNHPRPNPAERSVVYSLECRDIEGAVPGWKPQPIDEFSRRHYRNTNFTGDIAGSYSGSLKRAFRRTRREFDTGRVVDPLNPDYDNMRRSTYIEAGTTNENTAPAMGATGQTSARPSVSSHGGHGHGHHGEGHPPTPGSRRSSHGGNRPQTQGSMSSHGHGHGHPPTPGSRRSSHGGHGSHHGEGHRPMTQGSDGNRADFMQITHSNHGSPLSERAPSNRSGNAPTGLLRGASHNNIPRQTAPSVGKIQAARAREELQLDIASVHSLN